jgi:hypothetical protein
MLRVNSIDEIKYGALKPIYEKSFQEIDNILAENRNFDVIIDGMNFLYFQFKQSHDRLYTLYDLLDQFKELKLKRMLVIMREHLINSPNLNYRKKIQIYKKQNPSCIFHFVNDKIKDDILIIYASLKSRAFIGSHDIMLNHVEKAGEYGQTYRLWLYNKKFSSDKNKKRLIHPFLFKPLTHRVNSTTWLIPYSFLDPITLENNYTYPRKFLTVKKI